MRALVRRRLHGTQPGGDPLLPWISGLTEHQSARLKKLLPSRLSRAAVLVPLVDRPEGMTVLLTRRASHMNKHAGQISFPGGRIESQDAGPLEAALRETREEVGIGSEYVSPVGYLHDHLVVTGYLVTPAVAIVQPGFALQLDPTEVADVFEVPLRFILDPANHVRRERRFAGLTFGVYDIPFQAHNIWGATAGMLMSLYKVLSES
jgi:8-oxo-dGTP pyrophosphatase MutT (NUDIX family)